MPGRGVADLGDHIVGQQHIDGRTDRMQATKNVQRMMFQTGKRAGCEQQVDRDTLGDRVAAGHCRDAIGTVKPRAVRPVQT